MQFFHKKNMYVGIFFKSPKAPKAIKYIFFSLFRNILSSIGKCIVTNSLWKSYNNQQSGISCCDLIYLGSDMKKKCTFITEETYFRLSYRLYYKIFLNSEQGGQKSQTSDLEKIL